jgi:hypothetical protein
VQKVEGGALSIFAYGCDSKAILLRYGTCGKALFGEEGWVIPLENMHLNIHVQKP